IWSSRRIFSREVSHVSHKDGTSLIDAPISCLGSFAVDKYNKKEKANLKFVEVVDVNSYMVEGISYDVTLKAKDGEKMNFYKANIWVRPWLNKEELTEFRLAVDPTKELACFAIDEYNKKENGNLKFVKCLYFKMYSVVGELYHITLEAKDGENVNVYKAEVRERLYQQKGFLLTEFKLDGDASSVDSEKFPEFKSVLSSIFLNLKAKAASIWAAGFSQTEQSCKDLTITTKSKKLNPIDPPTINNLARFAVDQHNIKNKKVLYLVF
ncbi:cysteine protease inhibitor cystatin, partial [Medicago truncatula]